MLSIGITDILAFDFMDSPGREDMKSALRQLRLLGAISLEDQLTLRGRRMSTFPIEPRLTAAILAAAELGCTEEVGTIQFLKYIILNTIRWSPLWLSSLLNPL